MTPKRDTLEPNKQRATGAPMYSRSDRSVMRKRVTVVLIFVLGAVMLTLSFFYDAKLLGDRHSGIWPGFWFIEVFLIVGLIYAVVKIIRTPEL